MTPDQQTRERLAREATPGPWEMWRDDTGGPFTGWPSVSAEHADASIVHRAGFKQEFWGDWSERQAVANAAHIAANSPSVILADLARLRALEDEVARLREELATAMGQNEVFRRALSAARANLGTVAITQSRAKAEHARGLITDVLGDAALHAQDTEVGR